MSDPYGWFKVLHVVAVIVWIGGSVTLGFVTGALVKADRSAARAFLKEAGFFGPVIIGPASLITLLSGLAMAFITRSFAALWVQIGFAGIVLHFVLGAGFTRAASNRIYHLLEEENPDDAALAAAAGRLRVLQFAYWVVLFSVVAVMVLKPM